MGVGQRPSRRGSHDQGETSVEEDKPDRAHAGDPVPASPQANDKSGQGPRTRRDCAEEVTPHGLPHPSRVRRRPGGHQAAGPHRAADRSAPRSGRDPAPRVPRRRAGDLLRQRQGLPLPHGQQPVRHDGRDAIPLPRLAADARAAGRAGGRSGRPAAAPAAVPGLRRRGRPGTPGRSGPHRARCWPTKPRSTNCRNSFVARRRRRLHHAAAGLHRGPRTPRAWRTRTWACTACRFPAASTSPTSEVGLHYQIHRGIGVHHAAAMRRGEQLRVNVFVGGPPAMTVAAVMPLPEGMSELAFAGVLGRPPRADDLPARRAADPRRGRLLHHRLHRARSGAARRALRRPPGLLQPARTISP